MPRPTRISDRFPTRRKSGPILRQEDPAPRRNPTPFIAFAVIIVGVGLFWWMTHTRPPSHSTPRNELGQAASGPASASGSSSTSSAIMNHPPRAELRVRIDSDNPSQLEYSAKFSDDPDPKDADALTYHITFGDGTSVGTASGVHEYEKSGAFTVEATVTDPAGATNSTRRTVEIVPPDLVVTGQPFGNQIAGLRLQQIPMHMENFADLEPRWADAEKVIARRVGLDVRPSDTWYGLHFSGFIQFPQAGRWTLSLNSDDGGRLIVDGKTLINMDLHQPATLQHTTIAVSAGLVPVEIFYYQGEGDATLAFEWKGPGHNQATVPAEAFFHAPDAP